MISGKTINIKDQIKGHIWFTLFFFGLLVLFINFTLLLQHFTIVISRSTECPNTEVVVLLLQSLF